MNKKSATQTIGFESELSESMAGTRINKEKGVIEGVLILTGDKVSKNKTMYLNKAIITRANAFRKKGEKPKSWKATLEAGLESLMERAKYKK